MWILLAIGAAAFWGLTYTFNEHVYEKISVPTYLGIASLCVCIVAFLISFFGHNLKPDLAIIASDKKLILFMAIGIIGLITAELFIGSAIAAKNATLAGIIEISYPIFIALFSFAIFKSNSFTTSTIIGGIIIFAGIFIIYFFNR